MDEKRRVMSPIQNPLQTPPTLYCHAKASGESQDRLGKNRRDWKDISKVKGLKSAYCSQAKVVHAFNSKRQRQEELCEFETSPV